MEEQLKRAVETNAESKNGLGTPTSELSPAGSSFLPQNIHSDDPMDPAFNISGVSVQSPDFGVSFLKTPFTALPDNHLGSLPWITAPSNNALAKRPFKDLPPKDKALNLIRKSFQGFHAAYPIFDEANFMYTFESLTPNVNDPGWWASLNVVLALTHRFQLGRTTNQDKEEDREAWGYFQNALAVSNQLITMPPTLASVQALLGMSLVLQGTPNQGPVSLLTSSAIKLAQRMGLHRQCHDLSISAAEHEEQKRVFWIAYSLDKDISLQTGQPPTQDDDDMDVELPFETCNSVVGPNGSNDMYFFNYRVRLAIIQGQIYKRLCSVRATKQPVMERVIAAKELESMLQAWRASVPFEFQRDYNGPTLHRPASDRSRHPVILQLAYFSSLATIYGSLPTLPWYRELQGLEEPVELSLMSAPITYASEARKVIRLLDVTPRRNYACIWAVLHIFVSATTILLTHTLTNPTNPLAQSDLKLIEPLLGLLGMLSKSGKNDKYNVGEMYRTCVELFERTRVAVESYSLVGMSWDGCGVIEQPPEKESVEDFLRRMETISSGYDMDFETIPRGVPREFALGREF
ncbi:Fusaridione A cluster transcription factor fsdR [Lachnellula suecica]|uniref:Fusaridione A cluster transcription factor fsdR n=1 Tax=Lachnellula suecica TaxID=602035 RepID=A0A8T9CJ36_9HELO|nr:Fusaridione A cluster transcription factor fsdR [Lachnellula suecica]